jgi:hypothetical protein
MKYLNQILIGNILIAGLLGSPAFAAPHFKVSSNQAKLIALKKFPGVVVGSPNLENEEKGWEYGVMVKSGKKLREVMVDANSGSIVSVEVTSQQEESREAAADAAAAKHSKP